MEGVAWRAELCRGAACWDMACPWCAVARVASEKGGAPRACVAHAGAVAGMWGQRWVPLPPPPAPPPPHCRLPALPLPPLLPPRRCSGLWDTCLPATPRPCPATTSCPCTGASTPTLWTISSRCAVTLRCGGAVVVAIGVCFVNVLPAWHSVLVVRTARLADCQRRRAECLRLCAHLCVSAPRCLVVCVHVRICPAGAVCSGRVRLPHHAAAIRGPGRALGPAR
jgi:hypothetical protein